MRLRCAVPSAHPFLDSPSAASCSRCLARCSCFVSGAHRRSICSREEGGCFCAFTRAESQSVAIRLCSATAASTWGTSVPCAWLNMFSSVRTWLHSSSSPRAPSRQRCVAGRSCSSATTPASAARIAFSRCVMSSVASRTRTNWLTWSGVKEPELPLPPEQPHAPARSAQRRDATIAGRRPARNTSTASVSRCRVAEEAVAEPSHGHQVGRRLRVALDLLPQPLDVDVEGLRVTEVVGSPHLGDQEITGQQSPLPPDEQRQQPELLGCEPHLLAPHPHLVALHVELHRAAAQHLAR